MLSRDFSDFWSTRQSKIHFIFIKLLSSPRKLDTHKKWAIDKIIYIGLIFCKKINFLKGVRNKELKTAFIMGGIPIFFGWKITSGADSFGVFLIHLLFIYFSRYSNVKISLELKKFVMKFFRIENFLYIIKLIFIEFLQKKSSKLLELIRANEKNRFSTPFHRKYLWNCCFLKM